MELMHVVFVTLYIYGYYLTNSIIKHKLIIGDLRV
jgi:hypothetical protein